ncbi:DHC10, partial [Symbiodinium microadriaticum]
HDKSRAPAAVLEDLRQPLAQWWQAVGGYLKGPETEAQAKTGSEPETLLHLHDEPGRKEEASATLCGLHESLDRDAYLRLLEHGNEESLAAFLMRLAASQGNDLQEEIVLTAAPNSTNVFNRTGPGLPISLS